MLRTRTVPCARNCVQILPNPEGVPSAYFEEEPVDELPVEPVLPVDPLVPLDVPEELPVADPVDPPGVPELPMPEVLLRELLASEVLPGDFSPLQAVRASTAAAIIA